ncbi:unnamed protein product [Phytomonas sp. Hart1]|nr:unnamed protein product [Phytomonas sp. Hart1]|eukprot:CCW67052.1 unnamed protein product [Phytomonas sp. isolate Hart1]
MTSCVSLVVLCNSTNRKVICGTDTDCVRVRTSSNFLIILDGLDMHKSTPLDVLNRLPSWFGPKRDQPLVLKQGKNILETNVPLAQQGIALGEILNLLHIGDDDL